MVLRQTNDQRTVTNLILIRNFFERIEGIPRTAGFAVEVDECRASEGEAREGNLVGEGVDLQAGEEK